MRIRPCRSPWRRSRRWVWRRRSTPLVLPRARGTVRAVVLAAVAVVAVSAFVLSFEALAGLARLVGHTGWTAYLLPVVVDVMVAASTTALVLERPPQPAREAEATTALAAGVQAPATPVAVPVAPVADDARTGRRRNKRAGQSHGRPDGHHGAGRVVRGYHGRGARRPSGGRRKLVAAGAVKGPATDVAVAMAELAAGRSQRAAAAASGLHRTTVARLMSEVSPDQTGCEVVT